MCPVQPPPAGTVHACIHTAALWASMSLEKEVQLQSPLSPPQPLHLSGPYVSLTLPPKPLLSFHALRACRSSDLLISCTDLPFFKKHSLSSLFLAALGLHCSGGAFSSCSELERLLVERARASPVTEHRRSGFSSCSSPASLPRGMWDPLRPGIGPVSPVIHRRILNHWTTRKSPAYLLL